MFDCTFWSNFWPNLVATLVSVGLGIPGGLWVDRKVRARDESDKAKEAKERARKILSILLAEIKHNKQQMNWFHQNVANYFHPVRVESWRAFSDGGELQWINDPELVHSLSVVYAEINHFAFILDKYFDASFSPHTGAATSLEPLFQHALKIKDTASAEINKVEKLVEDRLKALGKH